MNKICATVIFLQMLAGCTTMDTTPDRPDFTMTLTGDYRAIADCATPGFRRQFDWTRSDLTTRNRIEFVKGGGGSVSGVITLEPSGLNQTRITSRVQRAIYGADYYANLHRPIFEACSAG